MQVGTAEKQEMERMSAGWSDQGHRWKCVYRFHKCDGKMEELTNEKHVREHVAVVVG